MVINSALFICLYYLSICIYKLSTILIYLHIYYRINEKILYQLLLSIITQRMNVVRELRNTVTHLQAQLQKKQQYIKKQQQHYQQFIASLQSQNDKLKTLLQGDSTIHKDEQFFRDQSQLRHEATNKKQNMQFVNNIDYVELINQNTFLRNQIAQLSNTYQKQIDQIVFYFQKIKNQNKRVSPAHYLGQIKLMSNWVHACMKVDVYKMQDYKNEREKYDRKLVECAETLELYEHRIQELNQLIQKLKQENRQNQQKLKMISRLRVK